MYRYTRLLVNLALNEHDPPLIAYAAMIARMARSETVYFAHVATSLESPADIRTKYPALVRPVDEHVRSQMASLVEEHFEGCADVEVVHEIAEGPRLAELLRLIKKKDIDLVLTGRHVDDVPACALAEKLARKATCSVLVCPDGVEPKITRILVPIEFIRDQELKGIEAVPLFRLDDHPAKAIARVAEEQGVDLVVMGARGRGAGAGVLLGSVTERLLHSMNVPLVAVKKKGYGMTVLDALLNL